MTHHILRSRWHVRIHSQSLPLVRARAYNDLHQHQGCIKTSIKWDPILMLFLIAPNLDPRYPDLMLVFTGVQILDPTDITSDPPFQMAPRIPPSDHGSQIQHIRQHTDPAFQMTRHMARLIAHHINTPYSALQITHRSGTPDPSLQITRLISTSDGTPNSTSASTHRSITLDPPDNTQIQRIISGTSYPTHQLQRFRYHGRSNTPDPAHRITPDPTRLISTPGWIPAIP